MEPKKTIVLDFDGVLHSYITPWKNARTIPDPPVPGAISFLLAAMDEFDVAILSSRSHQWGGRRAMKRWLEKWIGRYLVAHLSGREGDGRPIPAWVNRAVVPIFDHFSSIQRMVEAEVVPEAMKRLRFPLFKPPAHVLIDDRAYEFCGHWPSLDSLHSFTPWHRRADGNQTR